MGAVEQTIADEFFGHMTSWRISKSTVGIPGDLCERCSRGVQVLVG